MSVFNFLEPEFDCTPGEGALPLPPMDESWDIMAADITGGADEDGGNATPAMQMVSILQMHKCPPIVTEARKWTYSCLAGESCCDTGCCVKEYRKITQFWYGWFMLTIIGAFLLACLHYYKRQRLRELHVQQIAYRRRNQRLQHQHIFDERLTTAAARRSRDLFAVDSPHGSYLNFLRQYNQVQPPPPPPQSRLQQSSHDTLLMDRYRSARAQQNERATAPPPSYEDLMRDKHAEEEPPPVYLEACKMISTDGDEDGDGDIASGETPRAVVDNVGEND